MITLTELQNALADRNAEWDPDSKLTIEFFAVELAGETGEACNIVKKMLRAKLGIKGSLASMQDLKDELEDVIICAALVANAAGIDLNVADKFNATSKKIGIDVFL